MSKSESVLFNTKQAAEYLNLGKSTVEQDRLYNRLGIPYLKIGTRMIRYRKSDLDAFVERLCTPKNTSEEG